MNNLWNKSNKPLRGVRFWRTDIHFSFFRTCSQSKLTTLKVSTMHARANATAYRVYQGILQLNLVPRIGPSFGLFGLSLGVPRSTRLFTRSYLHDISAFLFLFTIRISSFRISSWLCILLYLIFRWSELTLWVFTWPPMFEDKLLLDSSDEHRAQGFPSLWGLLSYSP